MPSHASADPAALDPNFAIETTPDGLQWIDVRSLGIEGCGFYDTQTPFDRLPARAATLVREPVWTLSQHSAGMHVHFATDADHIAARWTLRFDALAMPHMPASGVSGLDLYGMVDDQWRFAGCGLPEGFPDCQAMLAQNLGSLMRSYLLYLPLYNGVRSVRLGIPAHARITPVQGPHLNDPRPMLFYGSSIVQGGCASRSGMAYPAIIARGLQRPHINLGFSGNAHCEAELAQLLAELDPCVFVLDPLPNMQPQWVVPRLTHMVRLLREARPATPILLVENILYEQRYFDQARLALARDRNKALHDAWQALREQTSDLHLLPADHLLGDDTLATVDGTHPTDLGFIRMAEMIALKLKAILPAPAAA